MSLTETIYYEAVEDNEDNLESVPEIPLNISNENHSLNEHVNSTEGEKQDTPPSLVERTENHENDEKTSKLDSTPQKQSWNFLQVIQNLLNTEK